MESNQKGPEREELGETIDTVWVSKAVAKECTETNTLTLTMPTRFMADFMRNNIAIIAGVIGIRRVEYNIEEY